MPPIADAHRFQLEAMDLQPLWGLLSILRRPAKDIAPLIEETHANADPAQMCMQMFYVLAALGQHAFALDMQQRALHMRRIYRLHGPEKPAIRLLAIMGPGDMMDNTPIEFLLEHGDVRLDMLYVLPQQPLPEAIPDHDIAIVAIGESDKNKPLLESLMEPLAQWPRPVLNHPRHIMRCARDVAYALLHDIPGLVAPKTQRLASSNIQSASMPFIIRPVDSHAGMGLEKFDTQDGLAGYCERFPSEAYFVSDYIDYQSGDGFFKKLRVALIGGQPYICHVALSEHWMVHYVSATMERSAQKRAVEAECMRCFDQDFVVRHSEAFKAIADRLGLDYVVLDCAETRDGALLLFEVDSRAFIHATDPVETFPYKQAVMQKAFDAFRTLLASRL